MLLEFYHTSSCLNVPIDLESMIWWPHKEIIPGKMDEERMVMRSEVEKKRERERAAETKGMGGVGKQLNQLINKLQRSFPSHQSLSFLICSYFSSPPNFPLL